MQSSGRARDYKSGDGGSALKEIRGTLVLKRLVVQIGHILKIFTSSCPFEVVSSSQTLLSGVALID